MTYKFEIEVLGTGWFKVKQYYYVHRINENEWDCTCEGGTFNIAKKVKQKDCKHVRECKRLIREIKEARK